MVPYRGGRIGIMGIEKTMRIALEYHFTYIVLTLTMNLEIKKIVNKNIITERSNHFGCL